MAILQSHLVTDKKSGIVFSSNLLSKLCEAEKTKGYDESYISSAVPHVLLT